MTGLLNARSVENKTFMLNDFILSHNWDFLFLTETQQKKMEYALPLPL